mmetsp:Transcript_110171/g.191038  ORF Transcript_110171/g.191038 Transcript_110171/m.191038 type:complete len:321 (+) Transcript_110171:130-1092(+)
MGGRKSKPVPPPPIEAVVEEFEPRPIPRPVPPIFDYIKSLRSISSSGGVRESNIEEILQKVEEGVRQAEVAQKYVHDMADHVREFGMEVGRLCPFIYRVQRKAEKGHLSKLEPPGPTTPTNGKEEGHPTGGEPDMIALFGDYGEECRLLADEIGQAADRARMAASTLRQAEFKGKRAANAAIQALMNPTMPLEAGKFHAEFAQENGEAPPEDGQDCHMACTRQRKSVMWPFQPDDPVGQLAHDALSDEQQGEQQEFAMASRLLKGDTFRPAQLQAQLTPQKGHTLQERLGSMKAPFDYQTPMKPVKLRAPSKLITTGSFL